MKYCKCRVAATMAQADYKRRPPPFLKKEPFEAFLAGLLVYQRVHRNIYRLRNSSGVARRCSVKKVFLKILQSSQEAICARVSFLIKLRAEACNFIKKETLAQVFCCEFCEITFSLSTSCF